jgi:hypothetical protein
MSGFRPDIGHATVTGGPDPNRLRDPVTPAQNSKVVGDVDTAVGAGVLGHNKQGIGVLGITEGPDSAGIQGESHQGNGVLGLASGQGRAGVVGENPNGVGVAGKGHVAGLFEGLLKLNGNAEVHGNINVIDGDVILDGADCAEEFDIANVEPAEAGMVMVLGQNGALEPCAKAYDGCVIGVISGAGSYKPGLVLDRRKVEGCRLPVAVLGKVFCRIDADYAAVAPGDLLTTSNTPGHAMKAVDHQKAFGAVIGKALGSLEKGRGLVPMLVALR